MSKKDIGRVSDTIGKIHYAIRGPVLREALDIESKGESVIKLNIGNTFPFGIEMEANVLEELKTKLFSAQGYVGSEGLLESRESVVRYYDEEYDVSVDVNNIFLGNGVSELISLSLSAYLDPGDEVLLPAPDYPLWSAQILLNKGDPVYYQCRIENDWVPNPQEIAKLITDKTRALVLITPNNPTGAVYPKEVLKEIIKIAAENKILIFADEIYERIVFDDTDATPIATLIGDSPCLFFNGLSKTYRAPGLRCGWLCVYDPKKELTQICVALEKLLSLRLCGNVVGQLALPVALKNHDKVDAYMKSGGQYYERMNAACKVLEKIEGLSFMRPKGAIYIFPKLSKRFNIKDDERFTLDFLRAKHVLLVPGTGFNYFEETHFRIVCLPEEEILQDALYRLRDFLQDYRQ